jgi:pimeloyl-ACP methyl ester carboxylesterase
VYKRLKAKGFNVSIVQNPTTSLSADVAATKPVLDAQDGPVVLVGHSYGGVVISEAGNDAKVSRLVYIAAFAPDNGESVQKLIANPAPGAPVPPILPPVNGFLMLDKTKFAASFAGDVPRRRAAFLANAQVPGRPGPVRRSPEPRGTSAKRYLVQGHRDDTFPARDVRRAGVVANQPAPRLQSLLPRAPCIARPTRGQQNE